LAIPFLVSEIRLQYNVSEPQYWLSNINPIESSQGRIMQGVINLFVKNNLILAM
jgi:hypothetical protein